MRILLVVLSLAFSGAALAHNCPNEMKAIDAKLDSKPQLSKENADKVAKLRADGEAHHKPASTRNPWLHWARPRNCWASETRA